MRGLKTLLVVGLVVLATGRDAAAQVGVFAGGVASDASVKVDGADVSTETRYGFSGGVTYATGGTFGLFFGGYYTMKGFDVTATNVSVKPSYIEVPVMGVVRLPILGRTIGPRLYAGVNLAYEVGCSTNGTAQEIEDELPGFSCDETNKFDFGLKGGLGLQVLVIGVDLAYVYGLTDIAKSTPTEIKNNSWTLTLSFGVG